MGMATSFRRTQSQVESIHQQGEPKPYPRTKQCRLSNNIHSIGRFLIGQA